MSYNIGWTETAVKHLGKLDKPIRTRILQAVAGLADEQRPSGVKKLKGEENLWRIRVAKDYRVVYHILDNVLTVEVIDVDHRSRIYKNH